MRRLSLFVALVASLAMSSCMYFEDISDRLDDLDGRLESLEGTKLPSVDEQISNILASLAELQGVDAELQALIEALSEDAEEHAALIEALQARATALEGALADLESYVDGELQSIEDWASATFATLEQYAAVQSELSSVKALVEQRYAEITAAYTAALADAIATSESSMKAWVNEQLAGYYTIAETDAQLALLQQSIESVNGALLDDIATLSGRVDVMEAELTAAYKSAIEEAIATNNGVIDGKIADAVAAVNSRVDSEVAAINARIDALEERIKDLEDALDKIKTLDIVFDIASGKACMAGASIEFGYTIVGGDDATEVESFGDGGWRADVLATDATSGRIRVTAPKDGGNGKVVVLATSGAGASAMKSIRFEEGILTDIADRYEVDWEACTLAVCLKTNVDYEVRIPAEAQSWLSVADTRATVRQDTLIFNILENPDDSSARTATVELVSEFSEVLQSFEIVQRAPIVFADEIVKMVCVNKFDTNDDGELSYMEASKVKRIDGYFFGDYAPKVKSFDELQYFVNVASIGYDAFRDCSSLTSINIPEGVTSIWGSAFEGCTNLTSITIPEGVTSIGYCAFLNCSSLTSINIPESVTSIGYAAFSHCSSLTNITIPESVTSIGYAAFSHCSSLTNITIPEGVTSIDNSAFSGCSNLTSITIPEGVTSIGEFAFHDCSNLTSITIPEGVTSIGDYAFYDCSSLTSITIPESVTSIGYDTFLRCTNLERVDISNLSAWCKISFEVCGNPLCNGANLYVNDELVTDIVIPSDIVSLNDYLFLCCTSIRSVVIPEGVTSIGNYAFSDCSSLTNITIPDSVTLFGYGAFWGCSNLTSITIPEGVTSIGEHAFYKCSNLTSITIPEGVTSIGSSAFASCSSLTSITIPEGVTSIEYGAFSGCSSLTNITIPEGVTSIGEWAFSGCSSFTSIIIPEGVISIGGSAFFYCPSLESVYCKAIVPPVVGGEVFSINASGREIYVPMESVEAYKSADGWKNYADSIVGYNFNEQ